MTQADGESSIHETMYDGRLNHVRELRKMGADIEISGRAAVVHGPQRLHGARVEATDIRSGAAVVLAALVASGTSTITSVRNIDRGYEKLDERLAHLGARIRRESEAGESPVVSASSSEINV